MGKIAEVKLGLIYGFLAYTAWGILPLFWKLLEVVPAEEILAHRIFWSFIFVAFLLTIRKEWKYYKQAINKKNLFFLVLSALIISLNWFTYIWAVNSGHVVEASMGYYINPLIVVLLGMVVLKEKLNSWQLIAIGCAFVGVLIITISFGKIPLIALTLAITFSLYGLLKKITKVDSLIGLALETTVIMPIAMFFILFKEVQGIGALGAASFFTAITLVSSGIITATPLLWFAMGAQRIKLSTLGLMQYIAPTISLFLGIFVFGEAFTSSHLISFCFIWLGLIIYSLSSILPNFLDNIFGQWKSGTVKK